MPLVIGLRTAIKALCKDDNFITMWHNKTNIHEATSGLELKDAIKVLKIQKLAYSSAKIADTLNELTENSFVFVASFCEASIKCTTLHK